MVMGRLVVTARSLLAVAGIDILGARDQDPATADTHVNNVLQAAEINRASIGQLPGLNVTSAQPIRGVEHGPQANAAGALRIETRDVTFHAEKGSPVVTEGWI